MYSKWQILKGLQNPALIKNELARQFQEAKLRIPYDIGVQGSYDTGNVGDRALGELFKTRLEQFGYRTKLVNHDFSYSNAEIKILGGGGVLHDWYGTEHLKRRLGYVTSGDRGFIVGVGVPGFRSQAAQQLVTDVLPNVELITVRDEWSKNNLLEVCDVDVKVTACPVLTYTDPQTNSNDRTGVNFRPFFEEDDITREVLSEYFGYDDIEDAQARYVENARYICQEVENPVFIPFHAADEAFARGFLDIPILDYEFSVSKTLDRVSSVQKMVTTRYHSLIFAAICQKDVLVIAYEPKVSELANRLAVPAYKPHKEIPVKFSAVSNLEVVQESAEQNFDLLLKSLKEP